MGGALEETMAPGTPPPPTTFCDGVVTTVVELGTVFRFAAPLNVVVPEAEVPRVVPPDVVEPTPMPEGPVVAVAPGVVVIVPVGETDIVPEPFSVAVEAVEPELVVVVPLFVGDVVTVLGVTWPLGDVVPIDVCEDVLPAFVPGPVLVVVVVPVEPAGAPAVPPDMVCANEEPAPKARASAVMRIL